MDSHIALETSTQLVCERVCGSGYRTVGGGDQIVGVGTYRPRNVDPNCEIVWVREQDPGVETDSLTP